MLRRSGGTGTRIQSAACVGLSVAALIALNSAVAAITSANCEYILPVRPGMNAAGMNTDISTSVMPMIGPNNSSIALIEASCGVIVAGVAHQIESGMTPHDASIKAMDELFGPIIGITLVLMSVFIPAAFMPGLTGKMYSQFALVIAATALLSAINAATLKPTQAALWMRVPVPPEKRNIFYRFFNRAYDGLERGYVRLISRMASASAVSVIIALLIVAGGGYG